MNRNTKTAGIIPARYASSRFPGKPLELIGNRPMIQHVYERASKAGLERVIVATDDVRILKTVNEFGGEALWTKKEHSSGTSRCGEALETIGGNFDVIINIQGDEPFLNTAHLNRLIGCFDQEETDIATLITPLKDREEVKNPDRVKCVKDQAGFALYFSRAAIPYEGEASAKAATHYRHLGLYAYRPGVLKRIIQLPEGMLERAEKLEQLRWLEGGYRISTAEVKSAGLSVDTPEDIEKARRIFEENTH